MTIRLIAGCLPLRSASSRSSAAGSNRRTRSQAAGYSRPGGHLLVDWDDYFPPAIPTVVVVRCFTRHTRIIIRLYSARGLPGLPQPPVTPPRRSSADSGPAPRGASPGGEDHAPLGARPGGRCDGPLRGV